MSILGGLLVLAIVLSTVSVVQVESRIDPVTGSKSSKTVYLWGVRSRVRVDVSPLETRLRASGISWTPSWQFLQNTHYNIFGGATRRECGLAPPIYELRPVLKEFAAASTDAELRGFVDVIQSGGDVEELLLAVSPESGAQ